HFSNIYAGCVVLSGDIKLRCPHCLLKKHHNDFSAVLFPYCHIFILRADTISRNTGKPALSRGISSLFTALSERACRDRAVSSLVTSGHSGNQQQRKWAIKIKNWPAAKQGGYRPWRSGW
ncbi:TPA: hypothetical protein ACHKT9_004666, partial [Escherichia coli]